MSVSQWRNGSILGLSNDSLRQTAEHSIPYQTIQNTGRETLMNANQALERLYWLEQAIADGRDEPWIYYHAAQAAADAGQTEKANRYLRIAMMRGMVHNMTNLTTIGELDNA